MKWGFTGKALAMVVVLLGTLLASPDAARARALDTAEITRTCYASSSRGEDVGAVMADPARWQCGAFDEDISAERLLLSFRLADDAATPRSFVSRRSRLEAVTVYAQDRSGEIASLRYEMGDLVPAGIEGLVAAQVPATGRPLRRVVVAFDMPTTPALVSSARLDTDREGVSAGDLRSYMVVSAICGMLLLPFLFNWAFWRVLRARFLLWHAALTIAMLMAVSSSSNLLAVAFGMSNRVVSDLATLGFGLTVGTGAMFAAAFIERNKLNPRLRRLLPFTAAWAVSASALHAAFPYVLRPWQIDIYLFAFLPVLVILLAVLGNALFHRSRAAMFQMIGWAPLIVTGVIRQLSYLTPLTPINDAMPLFYFGCAFEVLATALGVADRMMLLKVERDTARSAAREMERLADRDALTGLLNRRSIEPRFAQLRREGFSTMALIDLDHFKRVNDRFGHQTGDEVLRCCADVLSHSDDRDTIALRLGGEEFMLLLRGPDASQRAENLRQMLTIRVAQKLDALDRPVTASMGLVEIPREGFLATTFADFYARADKLLYEAKETGRNRSVTERLHSFEPPSIPSRRARAA